MREFGSGRVMTCIILGVPWDGYSWRLIKAAMRSPNDADATGPNIRHYVSWISGTTDFLEDRVAQDKLNRHDWDLKEQECRLCHNGNETIAHLLLVCPATLSLRSICHTKLKKLIPEAYQQYRALSAEEKKLVDTWMWPTTFSCENRP